jgi:hypothetical protein
MGKFNARLAAAALALVSISPIEQARAGDPPEPELRRIRSSPRAW